jgi:hypothetical protein
MYNTSGFVYLSMSLAFVTTSASVVLTVPGTVYTVADAVYFELISPPPPATRRRGGMARSLRRIVANFALPAPTGPAVIPGPARSGRL